MNNTKLSKLQKRCIELKHGINCDRQLNIPKIAKLLGVTHQNISEAYRNGLKKLAITAKRLGFEDNYEGRTRNKSKIA